MLRRHYQVELVTFTDDGRRIAKSGLLTDNLDQARQRAARLWQLGVYAGVAVVEAQWVGENFAPTREVILTWGRTGDRLNGAPAQRPAGLADHHVETRAA